MQQDFEFAKGSNPGTSEFTGWPKELETEAVSVPLSCPGVSKSQSAEAPSGSFAENETMEAVEAVELEETVEAEETVENEEAVERPTLLTASKAGQQGVQQLVDTITM